MGNRRSRKQAKRKRKQKKARRGERRQGDAWTPAEDEPRRNDGPRASLEERLLREEQDLEDARAVLREDPWNLGALVVLSQVGAAGPTEALALLEQAAEAAERNLKAELGADVCEREKGYFWGLHETRPYMRTRFTLAVALQRDGQSDEAFAHFQALLELCPSDNPFVRPYLAATAIELGRHDVAEAVCRQFADDAFCWLPWTQALLAFARAGGDDAGAREALARACAANPHVVGCLSGPFPLEEGPYFAPGGHDEAVLYANGAFRAWASTPGALPWLHARREITGAPAPSALLPRREGERLRRLPQTEEVWRVAWRRMPGWIEEEQAQPWAILIASECGQILVWDVKVRAPSAPEVWTLVKRAMLRPKEDVPTRPRALGLSMDLLPALAGACQAIGVDAAVLPEEVWLEACFEALDQSLHDGGETAFPAWTRRPGVSDARVQGLSAAAASYYRRTPWHRADDGTGFVLAPAEGDAAARELFGAARPCAVVMGAARETYGLALYDSEEGARQAQDWTTAGSVPSGTTVTYDPPGLHPPQDLERLRALGCRPPGPEVLPLVFRLESEDPQQPVAPTPQQLALLEAALRAIPRAALADSERGTLTVELQVEGAVRITFERLLLCADDEDRSSLPDEVLGLPPEHEDLYAEIGQRLEAFFAARPELGSPESCFATAALLCALPDSPVGSGYPRSWAAGIAHAYLRKRGALGHAILAAEVAEAFGVSRNTATSKARDVDQVFAGLVDRLPTSLR